MGRIKKEDIAAYQLDQELVCNERLTADEAGKELTEDQIITQADLEKEDDLAFCDRCKKEVS
jgi:hypothetical protein